MNDDLIKITALADREFLSDGERRTISMIECHGKLEVDDRHRHGLTKIAACEEALAAAGKIEPHPERVYILNIGLGADEFWGHNNNGDAWPEHALLGLPPGDVPMSFFARFAARIPKAWGYTTFRNAHAFEEHRNWDKKLAIGGIHDTFWNPAMHRVENILWISRTNPRGRKWAEKIDRGEEVGTSMAARVPFDRCLVCGNLAPTKKDYCVHLDRRHPRSELRKIREDGTPVVMINDFPSFFDDSLVAHPADPTAVMLAKVASEEEPVAEWPERSQKIAAIDPDDLERLYAREAPLPPCVIEKLGSLGLANTLAACDELDMALRPSELFGVVFGPDALVKCAGLDEAVLAMEPWPLAGDLTKTANLARGPLLERDQIKIARAHELLLPFVRARSYQEPFLGMRLLKLAHGQPEFRPPTVEERALIGSYHALYHAASGRYGYGSPGAV